MTHAHIVYDGDARFTIDPKTREIKNETDKTILMQGDHNSERFTFELPRHVDGHDMSLCNKVEVHYNNIDAKTKDTNSGVYEINDLQIAGENVICSWLISGNATQYAGVLAFVVKYACVTDGTVDYQWFTDINKDFIISESINNAEAVVEEYTDILAQWKAELFEAGGDAVVNVNTARDEAVEAVREAGKNIVEAAENAKADLTKILANAIKGNLSGETATANDVSCVEHEMAVKVRGKNLLNIDAMLNEYLIKNEDGTYTITRGANRFSEYADLSIPANTTITISCVGLLDAGFRALTVQFTFTDGTTAYVNMTSTVKVYTRTYDKEVYRACIYLLPDAAVEDYKTFTGIQVEVGETATEYTPYIAPGTVTVTRCGKNLFNIGNFIGLSQTMNGVTVDVLENGEIYIHGKVIDTSIETSMTFTTKIGHGNSMRLPAGTYRDNFEYNTTDYTVRCFAQATAANGSWLKNFNGYATEIDKDFYLDKFVVYIPAGKTEAINHRWQLQIESGSQMHDYEPYKGHTVHTPAADGTIEGVTSLSPNMTILTDTEGAIVECEYIVDTKTYIDKKIAELVTK